jgi:hypothetical protein
MKILTAIATAAFAISLSSALDIASTAEQYSPADPAGAFLTWPASRCEALVSSLQVKGNVKGSVRILRTNEAINYKLRALWFTPEVLRATARFQQLKNRLSDAEAVALLEQAREGQRTVIMVELDPNEGSGVIPLDWQGFLQVDASPNGPVTGIKAPTMREIKIFQGVKERDYDYERLWLEFPLTKEDGQPLIPNAASRAELTVRIGSKEGKVSWPVPASLKPPASKDLR